MTESKPLPDTQAIERVKTRYRKTALVEAEQFLPAEGKIPAGVYSSGLADPRRSPEQWLLRTLEGEHTLRAGDYICTGPAGEKWNVAREIFEATYEAVSDQVLLSALEAKAGENEIYDFVKLIGRYEHSGDESFAGWDDPGSDRADLDFIIAQAREIMAGRRSAPPPSPEGWQEIGSAPKDGQSILAICATAYSPEADVTWWNEGWTHYSRPDEKWHGGVGRWFPTHWRPLPAPPLREGGR